MTVPPGLIWDACALLNLAATGRDETILQALGCASYIVGQVRTREVFYLRPVPGDDPPDRLIPVDFAPFLEARLLQDVEFDSAERETLVEFAPQVDDGEAQTAAVAFHRSLRVATDDRAAIRLLRSLATPVPVWTPPEWVRYWAEALGIFPGALMDVLRRTQSCARYVPPRPHPLRDWWEDHAI